jgi:Terminase large subunit, T4likevirus-type, N-terminal
MVMARANLDRRLARLQHQTEMMLAQHRRALPDAVAVMQASGLTPDPWQREVLQSPASRVLMLCSRQSGKSTVAACLALVDALQRASLVLLLSPSLRQSQELFGKVLQLYRRLHTTVPPDQESALRIQLTNGGRIVSLPGTEHKIRGFSGVGLLIIDEAARVDDALYYSVRPMLAVSRGRLLALSTPFGKRGFFHHEWTEGAGWHKIKVTAQECPRISPEFLAEERTTLGPMWFRQEYECEFVDTLDQVFSYETVMGALSNDVQPLFPSVGA